MAQPPSTDGDFLSLNLHWLVIVSKNVLCSASKRRGWSEEPAPPGGRRQPLRRVPKGSDQSVCHGHMWPLPSKKRRPLTRQGSSVRAVTLGCEIRRGTPALSPAAYLPQKHQVLLLQEKALARGLHCCVRLYVWWRVKGFAWCSWAPPPGCIRTQLLRGEPGCGSHITN